MVKEGIKDTQKWPITTKRYVCFLDIMGFKELVNRRSHKQVFSLMKKLSDAKEVVRETFDDHEDIGYRDILYTTSFSDSIVIFTKDNSKASYIAIQVASAYLFEKAMSKGIPLKGALAFGEMSIDKDTQIFFGQPLIDAFLLQDDVFYYGVVVHNSAEAIVAKNMKSKSFKDISTPLKSGSIMHYNLNWFDYMKDEGQKDGVLVKKFDKLVNKHRGLTSGRPRKYLDNTIQVFGQFHFK